MMVGVELVDLELALPLWLGGKRRGCVGLGLGNGGCRGCLGMTRDPFLVPPPNPLLPLSIYDFPPAESSLGGFETWVEEV